jgi:uncharacterized membrane-anchored protein
MILGSYSISNMITMYKNRKENEKEKLNQYVWMVILSSILWIAALILLVYYWTSLELWAQVFGITGLLFNAAGPIFTLLVIYLGIKDSDSLEMINTKVPVVSTVIKPLNSVSKIDTPPL